MNQKLHYLLNKLNAVEDNGDFILLSPSISQSLHGGLTENPKNVGCSSNDSCSGNTTCSGNSGCSGNTNCQNKDQTIN